MWNKNSTPVVFVVKKAIENLLLNIGITSYQWITPKDKGEIPDFIHQGQYAALKVEGKLIGFVGSVHPVLSDENKLRVDAALCEIDFSPLVKSLSRVSRYKPISKYPAMVRDLAFVMPQSMKSGDVALEMKKLGGEQVTSVEIFDVYTGDKLEKGLKSVSYRICYQDKHATLQEEQVSKSMQLIIDGIKQKFAISMR